MILERAARPTLTPVQLNRGDELRFTLLCGETRSMVLEDCAARVLLTNCRDTREERGKGGTILEMTARVRIDGQVMTLRRYLCAQESFYEPYVVNGMRIWFDAAADLFYLVAEKHGPCKPELAARFAVQDAQLPICPQPVRLMCPMATDTCLMRDAYNGDDCWMGPYRGASAHGGLDINHPAGTPIFAPFDLDDQYYYNAVAWGAVNNRWRGERRWPDGSIWRVQVCHIIELTVPQHTPLAAGQQFARGAGVWVGDHEHSHFIFEVTGLENECRLDPWILFWQAFEHRRRERGDLYAAMAPLSPATVGEPIRFSAAASRPGPGGGPLKYAWTFGDGGAAWEAEPLHAFARPGVHPVTITVDDGKSTAAFTQHITVGGEPLAVPSLALAAEDEPSFRRRPACAMDVYDRPPKRVPHTLRLLARPTRPVPAAKTVTLVNVGGGGAAGSSGMAVSDTFSRFGEKVSDTFSQAMPEEPAAPGGELAEAEVRIAAETPWLRCSRPVVGDRQRVQVAVDASGLAAGTYAATVTVDCPGAINSPQAFAVELQVRDDAAPADVVVTTADAGFYATPYFWLSPPFAGWPGGRSAELLTGGRRAAAGEFCRFTPDLAAGEYEVTLADETPFEKFADFPAEAPAAFDCRVRHADGESIVRMSPPAGRCIGRFRFEEGSDGFVEILSAGSAGQVLVDAVRFRRVVE